MYKWEFILTDFNVHTGTIETNPIMHICSFAFVKADMWSIITDSVMHMLAIAAVHLKSGETTIQMKKGLIYVQR